jgi:DNA replication and repair protein RecF
LIRRGQSQFVVFGETQDPLGRIPLGVEGSHEGMRARIAGMKPGSLAELTLRLPVQIIDPEVHRLIEEGPGRRRQFLDWGVFHVEQDFIGYWQRYNQVLRQRNAALKTGDIRVVAAFDAELISFGERVSQARNRYVDKLLPEAQRLVRELLDLELGLSYRAGWSKELGLEAALKQSLAHDQALKATQVGPHRADLAIRLDGIAVRDRVSRGQQKLLASALLMAQLRLFPEGSPVQPTLLLDDPAAELDQGRLERLIHAVSGENMQLIVTTLDADFAAFGRPGKRYRIEKGEVSLG